MTSIIGLMVDTDDKAQTGNILLSADELITYSSDGVPFSSNRHGSKIYDLPCGFYVAIADDINRSHQVVSFSIIGWVNWESHPATRARRIWSSWLCPTPRTM
jgi:hypothetical protein